MLVTRLGHSLLDEPFRRSFFWDYGTTIFLGGLPAAAIFALKTYRNLKGWPVTQSVFALPVFIPPALYGLWHLVEAGFSSGTVGLNNCGPDPRDS